MTESTIREWSKKHKQSSVAGSIHYFQTRVEAREYVNNRLCNITSNCVQRPPDLSSLDPLIEKMNELEEYMAIPAKMEASFDAFVSEHVLAIYKNGFGWRRFFMLDWYKLKFNIGSK